MPRELEYAFVGEPDEEVLRVRVKPTDEEVEAGTQEAFRDATPDEIAVFEAWNAALEDNPETPRPTVG